MTGSMSSSSCAIKVYYMMRQLESNKADAASVSVKLILAMPLSAIEPGMIAVGYSHCHCRHKHDRD